MNQTIKSLTKATNKRDTQLIDQLEQYWTNAVTTIRRYINFNIFIWQTFTRLRSTQVKPTIAKNKNKKCNRAKIKQKIDNDQEQ
jgi:hypothetical protein